jgi:hypothetical protein
MVHSLQEADRSGTNDLWAMKFADTEIMTVARFLDLAQAYDQSEITTYPPSQQRNSAR